MVVTAGIIRMRRLGGRFAGGAIAALLVLALIVIAPWRWRRRKRRAAVST
jgi:hypothetical protein